MDDGPLTDEDLAYIQKIAGPMLPRGKLLQKREIGFASYEQMKGRTMAVVRGQVNVMPNDPKIWLLSATSNKFGKQP